MELKSHQEVQPPPEPSPKAQPTASRVFLRNWDALTVAAPDPCPSRGPSRKPDRPAPHEHPALVLLRTAPSRSLSGGLCPHFRWGACPTTPGFTSEPELPEDRDGTPLWGCCGPKPRSAMLSHTSKTMSRRKDVCLGGQVLLTGQASGPPPGSPQPTLPTRSSRASERPDSTAGRRLAGLHHPL